MEDEGLKYFPPTVHYALYKQGKTKLFYIDNSIPKQIFSVFAYKSEIADSIRNGGLKFSFIMKANPIWIHDNGVKSSS